MKHICNIVTEKELSNFEKKEWMNYIVMEPFMEGNINLHANLLLPTLIVGWSLFKRNFSYLNPNILYKTSQNPIIRWEFNIDEKMTEHFVGVQKFVKEAPRKYVETKPYRNIDPIAHNIRSVDHLIENLGVYLNLFHCNAYLYKDEIIYLYDRTRFEITGVYLNSYRYFGYDVEMIKTRIFDRVRQNQNNKATMDTDGTIYQSYYKQFPEFDQLKRSMVLFLA